MKLVIAHIRTECAAHVMRDLYEAGVGGITCYMVHGIRSEKPMFLCSARPFEVHHLPTALKLEMICSEDSVDDIVSLIADRADGKSRRWHYRGAGCRKVQRIRDIEAPS